MDLSEDLMPKRSLTTRGFSVTYPMGVRSECSVPGSRLFGDLTLGRAEFRGNKLMNSNLPEQDFWTNFAHHICASVVFAATGAPFAAGIGEWFPERP